jgi:hypothetical protein
VKKSFGLSLKKNDYVPEQLYSPLIVHTTLEDADVALHQREYERLRGELQAAHDASQLPELQSVRIRLQRHHSA